MTFHQASELMLLEAESRRLSPKTIRFYRQRLTEAERQIGNKPITSITHHDIRLALSRTSARSVRHLYVSLKRLCNFLMEDGLLRVNPMSKIAAPKTEQRLVEALTTSEIDRVLRTARQRRGFAGIRDAAILATLIGTGLRREELCELTDQNVRLTEGFMLVDGKGGKQRLVPLPAKLRQMMIRYQYARARRPSPIGHATDSSVIDTVMELNRRPDAHGQAVGAPSWTAPLAAPLSTYFCNPLHVQRWR